MQALRLQALRMYVLRMYESQTYYVDAKLPKSTNQKPKYQNPKRFFREIKHGISFTSTLLKYPLKHYHFRNSAAVTNKQISCIQTSCK